MKILAPQWIVTGVWLATTSLVGPAATWAGEDKPSDLKETIVRQERAALEIYRTHDKAALRRLCCEEFYEITSGGEVNTLQQQLDQLDDYTLTVYAMSDIVVTPLSDSLALIRYKIVAKYLFKGKEQPEERMMASAVWIKRGADWKAACYQEVKLADAH